MSSMHPPYKHAARVARSGFGLLELIITISIVAILAAMALPSFATTLRSNRVSSQANDLLNAVNLARNESITRTRGVTLCAANTASGVPSACGTNWNTGWMIFLDTATGTDTPVVGEVLRTWTANTKNALTTDGGQTFIRFDARGQAFGNPATQIQFKLKPASDCAADQQRTIVVTALGRSSSVKVPCS